MDDQDKFRDVENRFVGLVSPTAPRFGHGSYPCQGLYWTPKRKKPRVALIATHYNVDFTEHYIAPYMGRSRLRLSRLEYPFPRR